MRNEIIFSEGDNACDIIFVLQGSFKLYFDISDMIQIEQKKEKNKAFNVPFAL